MKVIGAGLGRTGTTSLQAALNVLGVGPTYHMTEVFRHPRHADVWLKAWQGEAVDWEAFFAAYGSGVDLPIAQFYQELMSVFPEARILLTIRDPDRWYASVLETIYTFNNVGGLMGRLLPPPRMQKMVFPMLWEGLFEGHFDDKDFAISIYHQHIEAVKKTVPAERLLVFNVKEGWEPLCAFLDLPIPDRPFPHLNDRALIRRLILIMKILNILIPLIGAGLLVALIARIIL